MAKYLIFALVLMYCILLALYPRANIIAQADTSSISNSFPPHSFNNATIIMHSTNSIQGNNFNVIKQEEPVIKKAILGNIVNAIYLAKGSVKSSIPVNVNARIINQLDNTRIDTTQGIDMTKKLIATELASAINTTATNSNGVSHTVQQSTKIVVDNQAVCIGIASPTKAACSFSLNIHG
ncbi:MAG: hypothetical protein WBF33_34340 [Candidatus Nitrosopolaris sp.]